ncbi:hypothetical protein Tco_0318161 [Tanacetum coccineum]
MIIRKDSEIVKEKVERKSIPLKAKKESSDKECSTSGSEDEEYAIATEKELAVFVMFRRGFVYISWFSKKQTALAISTTEDEYEVIRIMSPLIFVICYCIETPPLCNNLAMLVLKRMEKTRSKPKELLPYGMLLTILFKHVVSIFPELAIDRYILHDRVKHIPPLSIPPHMREKTHDEARKRPRESNASSSSTTLNHPSSSHPLDDPIDEDDDELFKFQSSFLSISQNISSSSNDVSRFH